MCLHQSASRRPSPEGWYLADKNLGRPDGTLMTNSISMHKSGPTQTSKHSKTAHHGQIQIKGRGHADRKKSHQPAATPLLHLKGFYQQCVELRKKKGAQTANRSKWCRRLADFPKVIYPTLVAIWKRLIGMAEVRRNGKTPVWMTSLGSIVRKILWFLVKNYL